MPVSNRAWPQRSECVWAWEMVCAGGVATGVPCACARPRTKEGACAAIKKCAQAKSSSKKYLEYAHTLYL